MNAKKNLLATICCYVTIFLAFLGASLDAVHVFWFIWGNVWLVPNLYFVIVMNTGKKGDKE